MLRRRALEVAFTSTGFAALALQIVWQRVISIHAGVDLSSSTTVVASFMAGLGLGSLVGGAWADRLDARRAVLVYGVANLALAAFASVSVFLFYDGYAAALPWLVNDAATFVFHFVLLILPTTLMGLSLPLLARGVSADEGVKPGGMPRLVGRLSALNTFGAALGAACTTWLIIGNIGFQGTTWLAAGIQVVAALTVLAAFRSPEGGASSSAARPEGVEAAPAASQSAWPWYLLFCGTGAIALGLELVYFRVVDAIMRSNSYTFGHVLTLYLLLYAAGAAWAAKKAARVASPARAFFWAQLGLGLFSLLGLAALVHMPETFGMRKMLLNYFSTDGYLLGPEFPRTARTAAKLLFAHLTGPLLVMGVPVFLMGASFPFIMAAAKVRSATVGHRVGGLQFANIAGNVGGSLLTGFVLFDALGTTGTVRLFGVLLLLLGGGALLVLSHGRWRLAAGAVAAAVGLLAVALPRNEEFWAFLHAARPERFTLAEERSCVNAWVRSDRGEEILFINATSQNGWPFDDFHVVIGLWPSLFQDQPQRALAIGLGAGSTAWGLLRDERLKEVRCVELCGGELTLLERLEEKGSLEAKQLRSDRRLRLDVGDGRKALLRSLETWDVITVDTLRPNSAYSGSVYSVEFYRLVAARLAPTGLFTQWVPTGRVLEGVSQVFPYVSVLEVPGGRGRFLLAGKSPIRVDRELLRSRVDALQGFSSEQHAALKALVEGGSLVVVRDGSPIGASPIQVNTDLFPRDEYFLNEG